MERTRKYQVLTGALFFAGSCLIGLPAWCSPTMPVVVGHSDPVLVAPQPAYLNGPLLNSGDSSKKQKPEASTERNMPSTDGPSLPSFSTDNQDSSPTATTTDSVKTTVPEKNADAAKDSTGSESTDSKDANASSKVEDGANSDSKTIAPQEKPAPKKRELNANQVALRDQVRQTLSIFQKQSLGSRQNTVGEILDLCLPFGCSTEMILTDNSGDRRVNAITCLCWNYPCYGFEPLTINDGHITARVGYGLQSQPSQFLATLAFSRVQSTYPLRSDKTVRTVADLVESEKRSCRKGSDLSLKLIGLTYYADDASWQNSDGEEWSIEKIVREELNQPVLSVGDGGMNRLLGLAYTLYRREKRNQSVEGQFARARKYLDDFHSFAFNLQNADGSWGYFLSARGSNNDASAQLRSTAYVLEWLVLSLPEDQLNDPRVAAAVAYVNQGLNTQRYRSNTAYLPSKEINTMGRALHALSLYDDRFFKPADKEKPENEKSSSSTVRRLPSTTNSR